MRALLRADRADDELALALARAGLYVERVEGPEAAARLEQGDVAVVDPRLLAKQPAPPVATPPVTPGRSRPLEAVCYDKLAQLFDRLGDQRLPDLYDTAMAQMERALLRLALERAGAVAAAAEMLGIHRNTLARRLEQLGLRERQPRAARSERRR